MKLFVLLILCVFLWGCTDSIIPADTADTEISETVSANDTTETEETLADEETEAVPLIPDEEITALIDKEYFYSASTHWEGLYVDYNDCVIDPITSNDEWSHRYYRVINPDYDTWEEWTAFLESVFYGQWLESILEKSTLGSNGPIINIDGYTYTSVGCGGSGMSSGYTYELRETPNGKIVVKVVREDVFDHEYYYVDEFVCVHTENGWRFQTYKTYTSYFG